MATHILPVLPASDYDRENYGIKDRSALVYRVQNQPGERRAVKRLHNPEYPHRVAVWDNTIRPNTDPESWSDHAGRVGPGRYVSPSRKGTDAEWSVYLSAESMGISPNRSQPDTGDIRSGQMYADEILTVGDHVVLQSPEGMSETYVITIRPLADPELVPLAD